MITLTKNQGQTLQQVFPGYLTYQIWVTTGDVSVSGQISDTGVTLTFANGTPGVHEISIKLSGVDPELLDTIQLTVGDE